MKFEENNDRDFQLAKQIGQSLENNTPAEYGASNDPLLKQLANYKHQKKISSHKPSIPSERIWNTIRDGINKQTKATIHTWSIKQKTLLWASIAAAILISILSIQFLLKPSQPQLLAQSENTIQIYKLSDGSKITLRPNSKIYLINKLGSTFKYRLKGEAFFDIKHNPSRKIIIEANQGEVKDLGTRFDLSDWGNKVQIYLLEGSVIFRSIKTNKGVLLKQGEYSSISKDGTITQPVEQNQSQYLDWLHNEIIFNHQKVSNVFDELEQHYNISIDHPDSSIANETISGETRLDSLKQSLNDLSLILGGHFEKTGPNHYRFTPDK